jgi:hypothetical protein
VLIWLNFQTVAINSQIVFFFNFSGGCLLQANEA